MEHKVRVVAYHSFLMPGAYVPVTYNFILRKEKDMSRKDYESRTEKLLLPIAEGCGVEIYDVEYV